jgi:transposase
LQLGIWISEGRQRVEGSHRRTFQWLAGVLRRAIIDYAKCAITRASGLDPKVQRAYAEAACGYGLKIDPCSPHDPQKKALTSWCTVSSLTSIDM